MEFNGTPRLSLWLKLRELLKKDLTFSSGRILGSMCTKPHPFAVKVFKKYIEKNIGDPGLVPATSQLEEEVIRSLGEMLSCKDASGYILSGGTEANIVAVWAARKLTDPGKDELILPESAHFSFNKAADFLGLKLVYVKINDRFEMDLEDFKSKITSRTMAIVAVAGSTPLGIVDPVEEIAEIALKQNIYLHVDAAFGGFVLPFLDKQQYPSRAFDFRFPGVTSITIDPHKMGLAVIPAGGILFRDSEILKAISMKVTYLSGGITKQATIVGTRPGASVLAVWGLLKYLGKEGYRKIVARSMELTEYTVNRLSEVHSIKTVCRPVINVLGIYSTVITLDILAARIRAKGWAISLFKGHLRICLMPHLRKRHIDRFVRDLEKIVNCPDSKG